MIQYLSYQKSDSQDFILQKIMSLYLIIRRLFSWMVIHTKHLLKSLTLPMAIEWNVSAIASLVGQGCLYILPCDEVSSNYNVVCFMPLPISRLLLQHQQAIHHLLYQKYNQCHVLFKLYQQLVTLTVPIIL